jgi:TFIIF-interacting CTD phosphatase-like protein
LNHVIIVDNSPPSYSFQPENALPIETWFDDENDTELLNLIPILEELTKVDNVRTYLDTIKKNGTLRSHV